MELKDKKYKEITCKRIKMLAQDTETQITKMKKMLVECNEEEAYLQNRLVTEHANKQKELATIKASIPDFNEETYQKYKLYFQKESEIVNSQTDTEKRRDAIQEQITYLEKHIDCFISQLNTWQQQLDKFNSVEKVVN